MLVSLVVSYVGYLQRLPLSPYSPPFPLMSTMNLRNVQGQPKLRKLFWENLLVEEKDMAVYTLKRHDHTVDGVTYPSLFRLYVESMDLNEYRFAETHLCGFEHWNDLKNSWWFKDTYPQWRAELVSRVRQAAMDRLAEEAQSGGRSAFQANKLLLELTTEDVAKKPKAKNKVGRPAKEIEPELYDYLDEDHKRILREVN